MTLGDKQRLFAKLMGEFLVWLYANSFAVTFGEFERPTWVAIIYAARKLGIVNTLHNKRLAGDLNLFILGVYQTDPAAYLPLGEKWESMHPLCRWGGRFKSKDANHFSLEHEGVR